MSFSITPELQLVVNDLEVQRRKIVSKKLLGWLIIITGIICIGVASLTDTAILAIVGAITFLPGILILSKVGDAIRTYKSHFKNEIITNVLNHIDQNFSFKPQLGIKQEEFEDAQLFTQAADRYSSEDLVSGKIDKTSFYFAEVHAEHKVQVPTKNGTRTEWHDIFKGIIFCADFNKNFEGITIVRPKNMSNRIGAWFSKNIFDIGDNNLIELESEYFSKNFVTYGTNQIETRYILTPSLMERLEELNERSAYCISLSFINSNMYIAFPLDGNYFEPPIFKSLLRADLFANDLNVLYFMHGIVHELDLNTRIWTKQ